MSEPAGPGKAPEVKYDYPGHEQDDANIKKVEDALSSRFSDSYKEGLANSAKDAPVKEEEAHGKIEKAKQDAKQEEVNNPDKVAEEKKTEPPPPTAVSAIKPDIKGSHGAASGPKTAAGGGGGAPAPKAPGKAGPPSAKGSAAMPAAPQPIVLQAAATGDAALDQFLDGYNPKGHETTERLSKIKEMAEVAKGFDGKIESTVASGGGMLDAAKAKANDFLGKKEMEQTFGENPYGKVKDQLSGIMSKISRVQGFVSIVGNVCTKLGLVLTILGLFGFIFPPIGAAIQAVARILNVVGLICDALGLILSGVLVGLNGVVLARQIGKGASNEEKAAVADLMMGEANAAGGHIMNLAMAYGGKFMAGIKNASKGVISSLFKRFKGVVGKFAAKTLGPVANWAKNIGYKLGFGLEKGAAASAPGFMSKAASKVGSWGKTAWNAPGKALEKLRETKFVKGINESAKMKSLERWSGGVNNSWMAKLDGSGLEGLGDKAGKKVFTKDLEKRMEANAQAEAREAFEAAEKNAVKDAGNKERAQIEREIKAQREQGNKLYNESTAGENLDEAKAVKSREAYEQAEKLEKNEEKNVTKAETKAKKEADKEWDAKNDEEKQAKAAEQAKATAQEKNKEEWKDDPEKFQQKTERLERDLKDKERLANSKVANPKRKELAKEEAEQIKKKIEERKLTSQLAGGKEEPGGPENLWQLGKEGKEAWEHAHLKDEASERTEKVNEYIAKDTGKEAAEKLEAGERHEKIEHWEEKKEEGSGTSEHVEGMLAGLDEELGLEPMGDHDEDHKDDDAAVDSADGAAPDANEQKTNEGHDPAAASSAAPPAKEEPKPAAPEEKKEEGAEVPELAYWPKLTGAGGEFAKSAAELGRMKTIAYAFRKAQAEAKKKAIEAAMTFNKQGEDASKKQQHAQEHQGALHSTIDEAKNASGAATQSGGKAGEGTAKQNESQGSANAKAEPGPDPGDKPGLLHPIKRIWWYVKKWVSDKATAAFAWIQEKIASMVLKVICGISMDDLKGYTTALHHRMEYSKLVGSQGVDKAKQTMQKSIEDKGKSKSYEQQALDDAAECDANMADADSFVQQVEDTERDLVAEQAKAAQFLAQLHAAVQAEKARKEAEKQKKKEEQAQEKAAATSGSAAAAAPSRQPVPKAPTSAAPTKKPEPKPLNPSAIGKVKNAASYVVAQTSLIIEQLTSSKQEQSSRLATKLGEKGILKRMSFNTSHVGDKVIAEAKTSANEIASAMRTVSSSSPTAAPDLQRQAGQVKSKAHHLDELAHIANENLNKAFKESYEALAKA